LSRADDGLSPCGAPLSSSASTRTSVGPTRTSVGPTRSGVASPLSPAAWRLSTAETPSSGRRNAAIQRGAGMCHRRASCCQSGRAGVIRGNVSANECGAGVANVIHIGNNGIAASTTETPMSIRESAPPSAETLLLAGRAMRPSLRIRGSTEESTREETRALLFYAATAGQRTARSSAVGPSPGSGRGPP
jgi:hypothetical protein